MIKKIKNIINTKIVAVYENNLGSYFFKQKGFCHCCEQEVCFIARNSWLRDYFKCNHCGSYPKRKSSNENY